LHVICDDVENKFFFFFFFGKNRYFDNFCKEITKTTLNPIFKN